VRSPNGDVEYHDIPVYFLERYEEEFAAWAANIRRIGPIKNIILKEGYLADPSPDPEHGPQLLQVSVSVWPSRHRHCLVIAPLTNRDRELITRHCEKLQKAGLASRQFQKEPPRPFMPFTPTVVKH
jgi:hypothetical protein